ncbi:MAG: hypothetical protein P4L27_07845 [Ignavibacteriaceae bacterium]|nr:hypothetical protein [Ignavibacteriaceae bacterium]
MSKIACIYFEGNDSKIALFQKVNNELILLKGESMDSSLAFADQKTTVVGKSSGGHSLKEIYNYDFVSEDAAFSRTYLQKLNEFFMGEDLSQIKFIPILSEPAVYFQKVHDDTELASLKGSNNGNGKIDATIGFVNLFDNSRLAVYSSGKSNYLQAIDALARLNNRKFLKIPSVKSAEISLASYILAKRTFPENDITLILYVGKEYSKLIFLKGNKLHHIGATVSVGKNSFNAHNVIASKILFEMENGLISNIENIIICGEDSSEELISVINEAYPSADIKTQNIESVEIRDLDSFSTTSSFIVPVAVAQEYYDELNKKATGLNLLPNYIKEEQKVINLQWHGYVMLFLILLAGIFFTSRIITNNQELASKNSEIATYKAVEEQNRTAVEQIRSYENKIANVGQTKAVLNQLSGGFGILSTQIKKIANFTGQDKILWISKITMDERKDLGIAGYTFSRRRVKDLADAYNGSTLENIIFDPLRDTRAFKFKIDAGIIPAGEGNETK